MANQFTNKDVPYERSIAHNQILNKYFSSKNIVLAENVYAGSSKNYLWDCELGHTWIDSPNHQQVHLSCLICSRKQFLRGFNDLETVYPDLAKEFDEELNGMKASEAIAQHNKKYYWKCQNYDHSYQATIKRRVNQGVRCNYCSSSLILVGFNDVNTTHPELNDQFDFNKNNIDTTMFSVGCAKKLWWLCNKGHSFQDITMNRLKNGCGICLKTGTSKNEQIIFEYFKHKYNDVYNNKWLDLINATYTNYKKVPYDVYIKDINLVIEYDGKFWHKGTILRDIEKAMSCLNIGNSFIRVREIGLPSLNIKHKNYFEIFVKPADINKAISEIEEWISLNVNR